MYQATIPLEHRISTLTIRSNQDSEYGYNRTSSKYDYHSLIYRDEHRRRLSSTGEGSGDSSTTTSASSYSEKEDGSEGRAESEENDRENEESSRAQSPADSGTIDEDERQKVETFFRGLKTQVFVSGCLANLYVKTPTDQEWQIKFPGIPVVILDVGEARSRNKRRIQIILAERGTCFMLWRDTIDNLTSYKVSSPTFHTMFYSEDHTLQVGFSFDSEIAAREMWAHIEQLIADPENISLSTPGKKKKKEKKTQKPAPLPPKTQISLPCCFQHITNVDHDDRMKYYSLKEFVPRTAYNPKLQFGPEDL